MHEDILEIVRKMWPSDSHRVDDWPQDERIVYRVGRDRQGLEYAGILLEQYRQKKMADAIAVHIQDNLMDYI